MPLPKLITSRFLYELLPLSGWAIYTLVAVVGRIDHVIYYTLPKFKQKCKICHKEWVTINRREFPICTPCHLRQIFSEEITAKKFQFLNISKELYQKSRFLRNIRQSYLMYKDLTKKQINAFKKTVKDLEKPKKEEG